MFPIRYNDNNIFTHTVSLPKSCELHYNELIETKRRGIDIEDRGKILALAIIII